MIYFNNIIFLATVELTGAAILRFFGISLPIVQLSGGVVIAALGVLDDLKVPVCFGNRPGDSMLGLWSIHTAPLRLRLLIAFDVALAAVRAAAGTFTGHHTGIVVGRS